MTYIGIDAGKLYFSLNVMIATLAPLTFLKRSLSIVHENFWFRKISEGDF